MKYIKMLGLAAVAAAALMAFLGAGTASATELYNGATTLKSGTVLDFSIEPGTTPKLTETTGGLLDECKSSTFKGDITGAGSSTTTVTGTITQLTWVECTFPTVTTIPGKLEIHHITGTTNGTVTSDAEIGVTINTVFFGSCVYGVKAGADIGTLTGNVTPATLDAHAVAVKLSGSAFACPETATWEASYIATEPTGGSVRVEAS